MKFSCFRRQSAVVACLLVMPGLAFAECRPVAGTIAATVVGGDPVNVLGTVSGDLAGSTRAVVTSQTAMDDGTIKLGLTHDFVTDTRGSLKTTDNAVWTPVPGKAGVFHMATDYVIDSGTGAYVGASGSLTNDGVADTNTGLVTLRYAGEVCVG